MKVSSFSTEENWNLKQLYVEKSDITVTEISSGVYMISKSRVNGLEGKFIDSQTVVRILEDEDKVVLSGLEFTTVNFELENDKKEGEKQ